MKFKFKNQETFIKLSSYSIYNHTPLVFIASSEHDLKSDPNIFAGFQLYKDDEETMVGDYSDYIYQWNIHQECENGIYLTNDADFHDIEPDPNFKPVEHVRPLSNEELTECVADLMYEVSCMQLGL